MARIANSDFSPNTFQMFFSSTMGRLLPACRLVWVELIQPIFQLANSDVGREVLEHI